MQYKKIWSLIISHTFYDIKNAKRELAVDHLLKFNDAAHILMDNKTNTESAVNAAESKCHHLHTER